MSAFLCPADARAGAALPGVDCGRNNYRLSRGDTGSPAWTGHNVRGIARPGYTRDNGNVDNRANIASMTRHTEATIAIPDGTSNTVFVSERCVSHGDGDRRVRSAQVRHFGTARSPRDCANLRTGNGTLSWTGGWENYSGYSWGNASVHHALFHTILPPNAPSCLEDIWLDRNHGGKYVTASSYHSGGVNVALADASVRFVNDSIDTGNLSDLPGQINGVWQTPDGTAPPNDDIHRWNGPTTYGVWGALGIVNSGRSVSL
jgi:prepilin-type processing-associated H-X9-DG protein